MYGLDLFLIYYGYMNENMRINTIGSWLKREFGCRIVKLSLDGGFTCPNRDGKKNTGGCLFCSGSGSGEHSSKIIAPTGCVDIESALRRQAASLSQKWPDCKYMAYFQSYSGTYAPVSVLRALYGEALSHEDVVGLAIATRPDCLGDDVIELLSELNKKVFLWVELGLQSIHRETMNAMNLCYDPEDYYSSVRKLDHLGIRYVTHLILGLPGETRNMMLDSVKHVCGSGTGGDISLPFGIKLHMLNVVRGTGLAEKYPYYLPFDSMEEYADLVIDALELIPEDVTIHRIYAEAARDSLISPPWAREKRKALNTISRRMKERDSSQGKLYRKNKG